MKCLIVHQFRLKLLFFRCPCDVVCLFLFVVLFVHMLLFVFLFVCLFVCLFCFLFVYGVGFFGGTSKISNNQNKITIWLLPFLTVLVVLYQCPTPYNCK